MQSITSPADNIPSTKEPETLTFYSPYGYIKVSKTEYESNLDEIKFTKDKSFSGEIQKTQLKTKITLFLKTFYGQRSKHQLEVEINEPIYEIIYRLISAEANNHSKEDQWDINRQYRLISSMSSLRELNIYNTYSEENIKENEVLLILSPESFKFSQIMKTSHIYLENKRKTAFKMDNDNCEFCLVEPGLKFGKRYIEFNLESEPLERNIIIGVSLKRTNFMFNKSVDFYGFSLSENKLVKNIDGNLAMKGYGFSTKFGDKIGMLVELSKDKREVSYYINKVPVGIAFTNLPLEILYPCVCLGYSGTRVVLDSKVNFPDENNVPDESNVPFNVPDSKSNNNNKDNK